MVNICIAGDKYNIRLIPASPFHFIKICGQKCADIFPVHGHNMILPHPGEVGSNLICRRRINLRKGKGRVLLTLGLYKPVLPALSTSK
jgi:hypothetical protein